MSRSWDEDGVVRIENWLPPQKWSDIAGDAVARIDKSEPYERENTASHRDGSFAAPAKCDFLGGGRVLQSVLGDRDLLDKLRRATGLQRLIPRGANLVIYRKGHFQGLHTDSIKSTVTVGIALTGNLPAMGWAPKFRNAFPDELAEVVSNHGIFPSGTGFETLDHPADSGTVQGFAGYETPHWRAPFDDDEPAILATLSYFNL